MNKNTKTVVAKDFAAILQKAFRRYAVRIPGDQYYETDDIMQAFKATLSYKADKSLRHISENAIITENLVDSVVEGYENKKWNNVDWYNITRGMAWEAAINKAFHQIPMPIPEKLPVGKLSHELMFYLKGEAYIEDQRINCYLKEIMAKVGINESRTITKESITTLMKHANEVRDYSLADALLKLHGAHFLPDEEKANVEVTEVKDLDKSLTATIPMEDKDIKEMACEQTYHDSLALILQGMIISLNTIYQTDARVFDDEKKKEILRIIGANEETEALQQKIAELTATNAKLQAKIDEDKKTFGKLKEILHDARMVAAGEKSVTAA